MNVKQKLLHCRSDPEIQQLAGSLKGADFDKYRSQ